MLPTSRDGPMVSEWGQPLPAAIEPMLATAGELPLGRPG